jgi:hypothetical protein
MATQSVYVDAMRCVTSEDSSDDIYLIMFRGRTVPPFNTGTASKGPGNFWTDFDDGELWNQDILMVQFFPDAVYAVAVVERDGDKDITGDALDGLASALDAKWKSELAAQATAGHLPTSEVARAAAFEAVKKTLNGIAFGVPWFIADDDHIGTTQRLIVAPGQTPTLTFSNSGGGKYRVRFKVASP